MPYPVTQHGTDGPGTNYRNQATMLPIPPPESAAVPFRAHAVVAILATTLLLLALPGCATHNNPRYNRFAPRDGRPSLFDHVEHATGTIDQTLDNFDERLNNIVW